MPMPIPTLMPMPPALPLHLIIVTEFSFAFVGSVQGLFFLSLYVFLRLSAFYVEGTSPVSNFWEQKTVALLLWTAVEYNLRPYHSRFQFFQVVSG
jgi:hypothetical protein